MKPRRRPPVRRPPQESAWPDPRTEVLDGYVIDLDCLRTARRDALLRVAAHHPRACALSAAFSITAFALVDHDGAVHVLDDAATRFVIALLWRADDGRALAVRVHREVRHGRMETVAVSALDCEDRRPADEADGGPPR